MWIICPAGNLHEKSSLIFSEKKKKKKKKMSSAAVLIGTLEIKKLLFSSKLTSVTFVGLELTYLQISW